jgi:hypothetical protein
MAQLQLADNELVMVDVVTDSIESEGPADASDARDLQMIQDLDHSLVRPDFALSTVLQHLRDMSRDGALRSSRLVHLAVPALAAAAPAATDSELSATFSLASTGAGGLNIKLGWFGAKAGLKMTVSQDFKIVCGPGQVKVLSLLLPFIHEVRLVRPPGGNEEFPVDRLIPVPKVSQIGAQLRSGDLTSLLAHVSARSPWSADVGGLESSVSRKLDVEVELGLEFEFGEVSGFGVSGSMSGSVATVVDFKVPQGDFELAWLNEPTGAALTNRT